MFKVYFNSIFYFCLNNNLFGNSSSFRSISLFVTFVLCLRGRTYRHQWGEHSTTISSVHSLHTTKKNGISPKTTIGISNSKEFGYKTKPKISKKVPSKTWHSKQQSKRKQIWIRINSSGLTVPQVQFFVDGLPSLFCRLLRRCETLNIWLDVKSTKKTLAGWSKFTENNLPIESLFFTNWFYRYRLKFSTGKVLVSPGRNSPNL